MSQARTEYAIVLAILGVLLSIGIPALDRGEFVVGGACIGLAGVVAGWAVITVLRSRK